MSEYRELTGKQKLDLFHSNRRLLRSIQAYEQQLKMLTAERDRLKMELHLLRNIMKAQNKVFPHVKLALPEPEQTELIQMEEIVLPRARGTREIKNVIKK